MAWRNIGILDRRLRGKADVQTSHRASESLAALDHSMQNTDIATLFDAFRPKTIPVTGITLHRGADATPWLMLFGSLTSELRSNARYLVREKVTLSDGREQWRWKLVKLAEHNSSLYRIILIPPMKSKSHSLFERVFWRPVYLPFDFPQGVIGAPTPNPSIKNKLGSHQPSVINNV